MRIRTYRYNMPVPLSYIDIRTSYYYTRSRVPRKGEYWSVFLFSPFLFFVFIHFVCFFFLLSNSKLLRPDAIAVPRRPVARAITIIISNRYTVNATARFVHVDSARFYGFSHHYVMSQSNVFRLI